MTPAVEFEKIAEMSFENLKKYIVIGMAFAVVGASFFLGIAVGYINRPAVEKVVNVLHQESSKPAEVDFSTFWTVWTKLETQYVDKSKIDRQKLVDGAIAGMVKAIGDPYTVYFPPEDAKAFQQEIKGSFGGIGAEIGLRKGIVTVVAPLKNSPAEHVGLKAGDKILKIGDRDTTDMSVEEAVKMIRGEKGTIVRLTIFRDGDTKTREFSVTRDTIVVPNITTEEKPNGIYVIQLAHFSENAASDFRKAVSEFMRSGKKKLVLDLRNNPGGYLESAVDIASWFLPAGDVVVSERWSDGREEIYRSKGYKALETTPVVILVNKGSASASEILAGALRDQRGIKLIGEKTFGKGSVQELENLPRNASLKITIAKWYTPSGKSINDNGLDPDITVTASATSTEALDEKDPVLDKALEILR